MASAEGSSPQASPKGGDFTRDKAKERAYNSAVKGLLYGSADAVVEEQRHEGKKSIPQSRAGGVPFATYDGGASQVLPSSGTHASKAKKVGAGKIGNMGFDPAVYRANIEAKAANLAHQKQKNWGSGQVMPDKEAPKDDSYEVGTIIETPKQTLLTGANPFKE